MKASTAQTPRIALPTASETARYGGSLGDLKASPLSTEVRTSELLRIMLAPELPMQGRVDAAAALSGRQKCRNVMQFLIRRVEDSTERNERREPLYTRRVRQNGILSAIALQGQITEDPELFTKLQAWLFTKPRPEEGKFGDKLARAVVMLGAPKTLPARDIAIFFLDTNAPDAAKIQLIQGMWGVNTPEAGMFFLKALVGESTSISVKRFALELLGNYRPVYPQLEQGLKIVRDQLQGELLRGAGSAHDPVFLNLVKAALTPRIPADQEPIARRNYYMAMAQVLDLPENAMLVPSPGGGVNTVVDVSAPRLPAGRLAKV